MNVFCRLFGHTWVPETRSPLTRWNTTKDGHILEATSSEDGVRHVEVCRRCGDERDAGSRRHDNDRPVRSETKGDASEEAPLEEAS